MKIAVIGCGEDGPRVRQGAYAQARNSSPVFDGQAASVFLASDDEKAKEIVAGLGRDMGFDPIDAGPLTGARDLEGLMEQMGTLGHTFE